MLGGCCIGVDDFFGFNFVGILIVVEIVVG